MSILTFTSVLLIGSVGAGLVGSLTGLGGGVVIVCMNSCYPTAAGLQPYRVHNVMRGFGLMAVAGTLSGLLGLDPPQ